MNPFSKISRRAKLIEVLRWLGVLPAALCGNSLVLQFVSAAFAAVHLISYGVWHIGDSGIAEFLKVFLYYVLPSSAFVIAGATIAPRFQLATAIALWGLGILLSLMTHVLLQQLAGNRVGVTNYVHFLAESTGLAVGAAGILWHRRWKRRSGGGKEYRIEDRS